MGFEARFESCLWQRNLSCGGSGSRLDSIAEDAKNCSECVSGDEEWTYKQHRITGVAREICE